MGSYFQQKKNFNYINRVGEMPVMDYYQNYKNLKRSIERDEHLSQAQTLFLKEIEQKNMIPVPYGMVQYKGTEEEINLKSYRIGDDYASIYGHSL